MPHGSIRVGDLEIVALCDAVGNGPSSAPGVRVRPIGAVAAASVSRPCHARAMDDARAAAAGNCASAYAAWAEAMGRPAERADDVWMADLGLPAALPPNNATLVRPFAGDAGSLAARTSAFFRPPGGGYQVWDLWRTLDLSPHGFRVGGAPCMVREAGGDPPAPPPELSVRLVDDRASLREAESVCLDVFGVGSVEPGSAYGPGLLASGELSIWVGRVDGRAVATSAAHVSHGFVGVYAVAVVAGARRRGYGEAVSWAATTCRPDLPATLQASAMGAPVYERMGYRTIGTFAVWERPDR